MQDEEKIRELVNELIEQIQLSVQTSTDVQKILQEIEEQGFTLNLSMLIGIFVRDREGADLFFSSIGGETVGRSDSRRKGKQAPKKRTPEKEKDSRPVPPHGTWTDHDLQFLESLGLSFE